LDFTVNDMYSEILYTNILRLLDEMGLTKNDLAARAGISVSFLSDLTNGKGNPSLRIMEAIAEALETPLPTLLEMTDLDQAALNELAGGRAPQSVPPGFVRLGAVLTEFQAFQVRQWDRHNRDLMARKN
jgi:transcriptional regulator with XRE-family HTH domain